MKTRVEEPLDREVLSALMDGQLQGAEAGAALRMMASSEARDCWQVYHLVGDVLRSSDLAACGRDSVFLTRLSARLQDEALTDQTLVPRNRGAPKDPSPKTKVINQEPGGEAGGVPSIIGTTGS